MTKKISDALHADKRNLNRVREWMDMSGTEKTSVFLDAKGELFVSFNETDIAPEGAEIFVEVVDGERTSGMMFPAITAVCSVFTDHLKKDTAMLQAIRVGGGELRLVRGSVLEIITNAKTVLQYERPLC